MRTSIRPFSLSCPCGAYIFAAKFSKRHATQAACRASEIVGRCGLQLASRLACWILLIVRIAQSEAVVKQEIPSFDNLFPFRCGALDPLHLVS
jgi:hypothetical protein